MMDLSASFLLPVTGGAASEICYPLQQPADFKTLNNSAMVLLRFEKNEEAIQLLASALGATNTCRFLRPPSPQSEHSVDEFVLSRATGGALPLDAAAALQQLSTTATPITQTLNADDALSESADIGGYNQVDYSAASPSNFFSLYNRVFVFGTLTEENWRDSAVHISAVLLYNTGLVWHRMALKENSTFKYNIALENYRMAHTLVVEHARVGLYRPDICDVLLLALCNNIGHIASHFQDLENARLCVEEMFAVFFLMENKKVLTKEEYVFFYMSILLTVNRRPILAPAA